jgi:hypothetical protein
MDPWGDARTPAGALSARFWLQFEVVVDVLDVTL